MHTTASLLYDKDSYMFMDSVFILRLVSIILLSTLSRLVTVKLLKLINKMYMILRFEATFLYLILTSRL